MRACLTCSSWLFPGEGRICAECARHAPSAIALMSAAIVATIAALALFVF